MAIEIPPPCVQKHTGRSLVCKANGRLMRFCKADREIARKITVDGCVIKNALACDFLVINWRDRKHFVELKGKDVDHAYEQLEATIPLFAFLGANDVIWCFIVCSEAPATTPKVQIKKAQFAKRFRARLTVKTAFCEYTLD
jgi:hypothetical protein